MPKLTLALSAFAVAATVLAPTARSQGAPDDTSTTTVMMVSDVAWGPLNPARGDQSPRAATLWGDRQGSEATGFLVEFAEGFSSPPHIHNVSYRGIVIRGLVHNDDPGAAEMWMPAGSFWTQPRGEAHVTAAKAPFNLAYIEIDEGPYLVLPTEEAFDSGERPINVDASNLVWIDPPGMAASIKGPKVAFLWGDPQDDAPSGSLVKLPAGFAGEIRSGGPELRAVVIHGRPKYRQPGETEVLTLDPGSAFRSTGEAAHLLSCTSTGESIVYLRTSGAYDVVPERQER